MNNPDDKTASDIQRMTAEIVSAFVKASRVSAEDVPAIVRDVSMTLQDLASEESNAADGIVPAVPIERSVTRGYIVCLEDGKRFKVLKSHLRTAYNLTPEEYRRKWGLPDDYPMVAPGYAARRSAIAKRTGLGRRNGDASLRPGSGPEGVEATGNNAESAFVAA